MLAIFAQRCALAVSFLGDDQQVIVGRCYVGSGQIRGKPRGYNGAGLVDEFRRPKLAFDAVKAAVQA